MKRRWRIMRETNSFSPATNAKLMCALAALHNFIRKHDRDDEMEPWNEEQSEQNDADDANMDNANMNEAPLVQGSALRERIANDMWNDYQQEIVNRRRDQTRKRHAMTLRQQIRI